MSPSLPRVTTGAHSGEDKEITADPEFSSEPLVKLYCTNGERGMAGEELLSVFDDLLSVSLKLQ
ncbi:hypothetical protein LPTSP3_g06970 [Leptospira kobayashii]|uniref:Uncharacterized protein n=1 Tax=Leptospira kobayashii TaxID=1917830 RepID=A0ABN6K9X5_9LEPT|nr:hypothetical protein LPTSP3_g06970 [Leptospira kobayashii]